MASFLDDPAIQRRANLVDIIIESLAHLPRELALATVMAWIPQAELESLAPTLSGNPHILD